MRSTYSYFRGARAAIVFGCAEGNTIHRAGKAFCDFRNWHLKSSGVSQIIQIFLRQKETQ
jgi:hypothetical protein